MNSIYEIAFDTKDGDSESWYFLTTAGSAQEAVSKVFGEHKVPEFCRIIVRVREGGRYVP